MIEALAPDLVENSQAVAADPVLSARLAGLRHVADDRPGIRRRRQGKGFTYLDAHGRPLRDRAERRRIEALAIPPAWNEVWICALANGHLQATGRDARGRKQYRYHPDWRSVRDETKFGRMAAFGEALPRLRAAIESDLARPGLPQEKVVAAVVRLLETTLIRVGNEEYARQNGSFGLTTLRSRHVEVAGSTLRFRFRGKSGKDHSVAISDRRVARVVRACRELPGHELFQYLDEAGERRTVDSGDVNDYLRQATGEDLTAKDFRTWGGTVLALSALQAATATGAAEKRAAVVEAVRRVADQLGNRPAICRKYYVHPAVIDAFLSGQVAAASPPSPLSPAPVQAASSSPPICGLIELEEQALALLHRLPAAAAPPKTKPAPRGKRAPNKKRAPRTAPERRRRPRDRG